MNAKKFLKLGAPLLALPLLFHAGCLADGSPGPLLQSIIGTVCTPISLEDFAKDRGCPETAKLAGKYSAEQLEQACGHFANAAYELRQGGCVFRNADGPSE